MKHLPNVLLLSLLVVQASSVWAQAQTKLSVGAAKVSITPPDSFFPFPQAKHGFVDVHDSIYARAIVVDDGSSEVVLVGIDFSAVPQGSKLRQQIADALGIPADHVMVTATHDHNTPHTPRLGGPGGVDPKLAEWTDLMNKGALEAARRAKASLQPARIGFGTGKADVNVNRDEQMPDGHWDLGFNPDRPSDKTVAVIRFDNLAGEPIAIYTNYAVHAVVMFLSVTKDEGWEVTGDLPGNTSRYVEEHYGHGVVALWTSGAAGDQNPTYMSLYNQVKPGTYDEGAAGYALLDVQSRRLGEEVVHVSDLIKPETFPIHVWGATSTPTCPGQHIALDKPSGQYIDTPRPPVGIPLSVIRIGDIAIAGVAGEPVSIIGQHFKSASPLRHSIFVNHAGPSVDYIPDDASYPLRTWEVMTTGFKEGCTEPAIVNGLIDLIKADPVNNKP